MTRLGKIHQLHLWVGRSLVDAGLDDDVFTILTTVYPWGSARVEVWFWDQEQTDQWADLMTLDPWDGVGVYDRRRRFVGEDQAAGLDSLDVSAIAQNRDGVRR